MNLMNMTVIAGIIAIAPFSSHASNTMPVGWFQAGDSSSDYIVGVDYIDSLDTSRSAFIESITEDIGGFTTMMQNASVDEYRGKRVQMTVFIQSEKVADWSGAWLRIDGEDTSAIAFDNMNERAIKGSTNWKQYSIVLDVPENADKMAFGVLIKGTGKVRFDNFDFKVVDNKTPVTNMEVN